MDREIFDQNSPFIYCPHCAEKISRHVVTCPKCRQKTLKVSKLPMIGFVVVGVIMFAGLLAAITIPAYKEYQKRAAAAQIAIEEKSSEINTLEQDQKDEPKQEK